MTDQGTDGELRGHDALLAANDRLATVLAQRNRRELTASGAVVSVFLIYAVIIPGCVGAAWGSPSAVVWSEPRFGEPAVRAP